MNVEEHHRAADDLDRVADEHDAPLRHRIGEGADESGQRDVGDGEEGLEQRLVRRRRVHFTQSGDGNNQQGIVGER